MGFEYYGRKRTNFSPLCQMGGEVTIKKVMFSVIIATGIKGIVVYFA